MRKDFHVNEITGKRKLVVLVLPAEAWEKLDMLWEAAQTKLPGISHDTIVSSMVLEMLSRTPTLEPPGATVDTERKKLNDH